MQTDTGKDLKNKYTNKKSIIAKSEGDALPTCSLYLQNRGSLSYDTQTQPSRTQAQLRRILLSL